MSLKNLMFIFKILIFTIKYIENINFVIIIINIFNIDFHKKIMKKSLNFV